MSPAGKHRRGRTPSVLVTAFILTVGLTPLGASAADHLDSPSVKKVGAADITDVYAFSTSDRTRTVLIMGVNPGAGVLPNSSTTFGPGVDYRINVDTNGDLRPNVVYSFRFAAPVGGRQAYSVRRNGSLYASGRTGADIPLPGNGRVRAGLFDDPFFFDLAAFQGAVLGSGNGRTFCDSGTTNFFAGLNLSAIVLMVPNSSIGGTGRSIGVWATTWVRRSGTPVQLDQMGRPAINTVFNSTSSDKELFNRAAVSEQTSLGFRANVRSVLVALGGYSTTDAQALAKVLIPDVLTYKTGDRSGFLNGRRLRDDVIDIELGLVTKGGIASDCVGSDSAFRSTFPFLAPAN